MGELEKTFPATDTRVEQNSAERVNAEIRSATEGQLHRFAGADRNTIDGRLRQLDREWDIERVLETNASIIACTGALLALTVNRRFAIIPVVVTGFLLQHALQGWCPPLPWFRKRGVRTMREINRERTALRILRGDFQSTSDASDAYRQAAEN